MILRLRIVEPAIGTVVIKTRGNRDTMLRLDELLLANQDHWLVREIIHFMKRTLKRIDLTSRSFFALIEPGSCFAGTLFELALAADRSYMLDDPDHENAIALSRMNSGPLPMSNGLTRLQTRFLAQPEQIARVLERNGPFDPRQALDAGLVSFAPDELDWDDEVRLAIESRAALSPDALTGMEANLRFAGPETMETKIFGRLTAWQNWIFIRPNAVGAKGALTAYGSQSRPEFDFNRTKPRNTRNTLMISAERIPNNVGLHNKRLQRALEHWQPKYIQWWSDMGPQGFQDYHQVLRTAVSIPRWSHFEHEAAGIAGASSRRSCSTIAASASAIYGQLVWQEVPENSGTSPPPRRHAGGHGTGQRGAAAMARPAVSQLRTICEPSVNVEEGRHPGRWSNCRISDSAATAATKRKNCSSGRAATATSRESSFQPNIENRPDFFMITNPPTATASRSCCRSGGSIRCRERRGLC